MENKMSASQRLSRFSDPKKQDIAKQPPLLDADTINNEANKQTTEVSQGTLHTTSHGHQHSNDVEPKGKSSAQHRHGFGFHHFHVPARFKRHRPPPLTAGSDSGSTNSKLKASNSSVKNMKEAKLKFIKAVHEAIIEKFHSYAVVLTILASITFVAILQPPGAFTPDGNMRPPILVGCFLFFSTLSFFLACTGLLAVVSGTASMFRPGFFLNLDLKFPSTLATYFASMSNGVLQESKKGSKRGEDSELDDPKVLAFLVLGNLHRAWRLRVYLVASLLSCVVAFVCGAFATMDGGDNRTAHLLAGAVAVGGMTMVFEVVKSHTGLTASYSGTWHTTFRSIPMLKETHPWESTVSNILRNVTPHHSSVDG